MLGRCRGGILTVVTRVTVCASCFAHGRTRCYVDRWWAKVSVLQCTTSRSLNLARLISVTYLVYSRQVDKYVLYSVGMYVGKNLFSK
ncbi:hypothetical protein F4859DRAFT_473418 [Xylaria cf. heliscus]|nr:hypothetical protein F4859DRAFT_473418 [Xylaria cf. heliscus]